MDIGKNQYQVNQYIETFIQQKDLLKESYSAEEKALIRRYSGSGGLASKGAKADAGLLYEFYTPDWLCKKVWELALHYGYDGGTVLEPSVATGNFFEDAPDKSKCTGFETNPISARIAKILYPEATLHTGYFETAFLQPPRFTTKIKDSTTWLKGYPFSLVIGNPPYGIYKNRYSTYFDKKLFRQIELFFIYQGLQLLKKDGLLIYVISQNFLRNGDKYATAKAAIGKIADLQDAYRLPKVFSHSDVPTDIIILRKK